MKDIYNQVKTIISEKVSVNISDIKPDSRLIDDLHADSLDIVQILTEFERRFNIHVVDVDPKSIVTVEDAVRFIQERLKD